MHQPMGGNCLLWEEHKKSAGKTSGALKMVTYGFILPPREAAHIPKSEFSLPRLTNEAFL